MKNVPQTKSREVLSRDIEVALLSETLPGMKINAPRTAESKAFRRDFCPRAHSAAALSFERAYATGATPMTALKHKLIPLTLGAGHQRRRRSAFFFLF